MKPELEDILKHYGVKGMKWKQTKAKVEEVVDEAGEKINEVGDSAGDSIEDFLDGAGKVAKRLGKKFSKVDDVLAKFGKKSLAQLKDKYYDVQEAHYRRQNTKNAARAINAAMKNGGELPKGYKKDQVKVSDRQKELAAKYIKALNKELKRQDALDKKVKQQQRKELDRP